MFHKLKNFVYKKVFQSIHGFDPVHATFTHNLWTLASWDKDEVPHLAINNNRFLDKIDKQWREIAESQKNDTVLPLSSCVINGLAIPKLLSFDQRHNILTNPGMTEMAKRSTAESQTTNSHHAIGTGTTTENISDVTLEEEIARKAIGTRRTVNQTERYGSAFSDGDVTPPQDVTEAGILTANIDGILILRVTSSPQSLEIGKIITVQTNVTHENGSQII